MNIRRISTFLAVGLSVVLVFCGARAVADDAETLQNLISKLRHNPADQELRKKIIQLVAGMNPKPAVPLAAVEHEGAGEFKFRNAKSADDFAQSANEYGEALLVAPWVAADYYNQGIAWEKAMQLGNAVAAYELYLIAAPRADDATDVAKRIGALRAAAQKPSPARINDPPDDKDFIKSLDGARYELRRGSVVWSYEIQGDEVVNEGHDREQPSVDFGVRRNKIIGRKFVNVIKSDDCEKYFGTPKCYSEGTISEKEISIQSIVNERPVGQKLFWDVTFKRVKNGK